MKLEDFKEGQTVVNGINVVDNCFIEYPAGTRFVVLEVDFATDLPGPLLLPEGEDADNEYAHRWFYWNENPCDVPAANVGQWEVV